MQLLNFVDFDSVRDELERKVNCARDKQRVPLVDDEGLHVVLFATSVWADWEEITLTILLWVHTREQWESTKSLCMRTKKTDTIIRAFDSLFQ